MVATTRPETLLGDTAVAVNPEDPRYVDLPDDTVLLPLLGRELPGHPRPLRVHLDFGTGALKITPAHDPNDFMIGQKHGLASIRMMDDNGTRSTKKAAPTPGLDRFEARERDAGRSLEAQGLLEKQDEYLHNGGALLPLQDHGGADFKQAVVRQGGPPGRRRPWGRCRTAAPSIVPVVSGKRPTTSG